MTPKGQHIHWLYLWLAISATGNIIGMASLVEGLVTWADFFKHVIELYRDNIRAPVAWVGNHLWPFGKLPAWLFDIFILYGVFIIAFNIMSLRESKMSFFCHAYYAFTGRKSAFFIPFILALPIIAIVAFFWVGLSKLSGRSVSDVNQRVYKAGSEVLSYCLGLVAVFIIILLINYQVLKLQIPH